MIYFLFDFDGTVAHTFEHQGSIGVNQATELAINDVFGRDALDVYSKSGGHQNGAPVEVITRLLSDANSSQFIRSAEQFFIDHAQNLLDVVPAEKNIPFVWNRAQPTNVAVELFVRQKLLYLLDQIGSSQETGELWPYPTKGFIQFWNKLQETSSRIPLRTGIISSGHESFITKTFDAWGISRPDILVTDDDIRGRTRPKEFDRRVKPGPLPLAIAHYDLLKNEEHTGFNFNYEYALAIRNRMIYFGDSDVKDGGLARNSGIIFGHFVRNQTGVGIIPEENKIAFGDWNDVSILLNNSLFGDEGKITAERLMNKEKI